MELVIPRDIDGPEFAKLAKCMIDSHGLSIGYANDNPLLDTCIYEVKYDDGYKVSLAANTIATNLFAQVDAERNRHVLLDQIVDYCPDVTDIKQGDTFTTSKNVVCCRQETMHLYLTFHVPCAPTCFWSLNISIRLF